MSFRTLAIAAAVTFTAILGLAQVSEACGLLRCLCHHHCRTSYSGYSYPTNNAAQAMTLDQWLELARRLQPGPSTSGESPSVKALSDEVAALKLQVGKNTYDIQELAKSQAEIANVQDDRFVLKGTSGGAASSSQDILDRLTQMETNLTKKIGDESLATEGRIKKWAALEFEPRKKAPPKAATKSSDVSKLAKELAALVKAEGDLRKQVEGGDDSKREAWLKKRAEMQAKSKQLETAGG